MTSEQSSEPPSNTPAAEDAPLVAKRIPLIGHLPVGRQLTLLIVAVVICLLVAAVAAYFNGRASDQRTGYVTESSKLLLLSQRWAKDAQSALLGDAQAFADIADTKEIVVKTIAILDKGDKSLPATSGVPRKVLNDLKVTLDATYVNVQQVLDGRDGLVTLFSVADAINSSNDELRSVAQQLMEGYSGEQKAAAIRMALAVERVAKSVSKSLAASQSESEQLVELAQVAIASNVIGDSLNVLPGGDSRVKKAKDLLESYRGSIEIMISQARRVVGAKEGAHALLRDTDTVLAQSQTLVDAYSSAGAGGASGTMAVLAAIAALLLMLLAAKVYLDDTAFRAAEAEQNNKRTQDSILRLMNEMGDLADGDLTVHATVSEDITGAIADSVNYTTEELRKLVSRIIVSADQMNNATKTVDEATRSLSASVDTQVREIKEAEESVQLITRSIGEVDAAASKATEVGRQTLDVAAQGAQSVRNTIAGMDGIREQIQETAKRIKRLGESSQQIGEIVGLIADITEQTNVLALNAAIQAASAGEAGRGFSVVAEEVQRLAERSGEATKQIGLLVRAIQGDTQDAIAAMEKSTVGVVEGARLSDEAGQALQEIERVSNELSDLINSISVSTQMQNDMATEVAEVMQDILKISEQTSEGTKRTSGSVVQLASLTGDLKTSVSGFKL
ncbi:MAG: methyl-accepting chemotaxis protein [Pseudomonadota bacterium]